MNDTKIVIPGTFDDRFGVNTQLAPSGMFDERFGSDTKMVEVDPVLTWMKAMALAIAEEPSRLIVESDEYGGRVIVERGPKTTALLNRKP